MLENLIEKAQSAFAEIDGNILELANYITELQGKVEKATSSFSLVGIKKSAELRSELQQAEETLARAKARRAEMADEFSQGIWAEIEQAQDIFIQESQKKHKPELKEISDTIDTLRDKIKALEKITDAEKAEFSSQVRLLKPYTSGKIREQINDFGYWAMRSFSFCVPDRENQLTIDRLRHNR